MARPHDGKWVVTFLNLRGEFSYRFYKTHKAAWRWAEHMKTFRSWVIVSVQAIGARR